MRTSNVKREMSNVIPLELSRGASTKRWNVKCQSSNDKYTNYQQFFLPGAESKNDKKIKL